MGCIGSMWFCTLHLIVQFHLLKINQKSDIPYRRIQCIKDTVCLCFLCWHIIACDVHCMPFHARLICIPIATSQQATVLTRSIISCTLPAASTSVWTDWPSLCVHEGNKKEDWAKGRKNKKTQHMWSDYLCIWLVQISIARCFFVVILFFYCVVNQEKCCLWGSKKDTGLGLRACGSHTV